MFLRILLALVANTACIDGSASAESVSAQAIVDGTPDVTTDAVVAVGFGTGPYCSGVLVAPKVVLTAAHCIPDTVEGLIVSAGWNTTGPQISVAARSALAHPSYRDGTNDIGLIALVEPMAVPPIDLAAPSLVATLVPGSTVVIAGWGRGSDGRAIAKLEGRAQIRSVTARTFQLAPSPAITCDGDSGGPLFVTAPDGTRRVAGIHSLSNCNDLAVDERVDVHADFIAPFIADVETHRICVGGECDQLSGGCSTGSDHGSWLALLGALLFICRFSPRRVVSASSVQLQSPKDLSCSASN